MRLAALAALSVLGLSALGATCGSDSSTTTYDVSINFNESVSQQDLDETAAIVKAYDKDARYLLQESFPPVGRATVETSHSDFCAKIKPQLEVKSYVTSVTCREHVQPPSDGGDTPVSSTPTG